MPPTPKPKLAAQGESTAPTDVAMPKAAAVVAPGPETPVGARREVNVSPTGDAIFERVTETDTATGTKQAAVGATIGPSEIGVGARSTQTPTAGGGRKETYGKASITAQGVGAEVGKSEDQSDRHHSWRRGRREVRRERKSNARGRLSHPGREWQLDQADLQPGPTGRRERAGTAAGRHLPRPLHRDRHDHRGHRWRGQAHEGRHGRRRLDQQLRRVGQLGYAPLHRQEGSREVPEECRDDARLHAGHPGADVSG